MSVIVSRFAIVTEDLAIYCYQVTKFVSTKYGSANASSARKSCDFGPLADLAIFLFREVGVDTVFTQILTSLEYGLQRYFMRRTGVRVSVYWNFIIHQNFPEFLQPLRVLRTQRVAPFYRAFLFILLLEFYWLEFHQVALIYHQENLTVALKRCHSHSYLLVLESEFHLL